MVNLDETRPVTTALLKSNPNANVMDANIVVSIGISIAASEKGMGIVGETYIGIMTAMYNGELEEKDFETSSGRKKFVEKDNIFDSTAT